MEACTSVGTYTDHNSFLAYFLSFAVLRLNDVSLHTVNHRYDRCTDL